MIKINMNEQCKVKLTPYGEQILVNHYTEAYSADDVRRMIEQIHKPNIVTGYTFSMWELFKIFGPTFHIGMHEVPFEENCICFN